jgi:hypothetical protein
MRADQAVYPVSYSAVSLAEAELFAAWIGTAAEAKQFIRERCEGAVVSPKLAEFIVSNGAYQYAYILEVRHASCKHASFQGAPKYYMHGRTHCLHSLV